MPRRLHIWLHPNLVSSLRIRWDVCLVRLDAKSTNNCVPTARFPWFHPASLRKLASTCWAVVSFHDSLTIGSGKMFYIWSRFLPNFPGFQFFQVTDHSADSSWKASAILLCSIKSVPKSSVMWFSKQIYNWNRLTAHLHDQNTSGKILGKNLFNMMFIE